MAVDKELELLISEKELEFGDKQVVVKKISMLDTIRIASRLSDIITKVMDDSDVFSTAVAKLAFEPENGEDATAIRVMGLLELLGALGEDGADLLKNIIAKSTTLTPAEVEDLDIVEGLDIIMSVYEVNRGFFMKCGKKLMAKMEKPKAKTKKK